MAYPYVEVEPRRYRFLFLNGSQARFFNMQLYFAQSSDLSNPLSGEADLVNATNVGIPQFVQIATEGGFLPAPVIFPNNPPAQIGFDMDQDPTEGNATRYNLLLAPAERADVIFDFSNVKPGSVMVLYNDAPAPFPGGDPRNNYYTGDPDYTTTNNPDGLSGGAPTTQPGYGPNTKTLMQIRVVPLKGSPDPQKTLPRLPALDPAPIFPIGKIPTWISDPNLVANPPKGVDKVRDLTLNEYFDESGRLIQLLGNTTDLSGTAPDGTRLYGQPYFDPNTLMSSDYQSPRPNTVEVWRIFNTTGDTHPMHFHLVNVQILARQAYNADLFDTTGQLEFGNWPADLTTGRAASPRPPDPNELGWKETVRMNPGEVITVAMRFGLPPDPIVDREKVQIPFSPRFLVMGIKGYEYVWHCHILEHEEHDMMHSLLVQP